MNSEKLSGILADATLITVTDMPIGVPSFTVLHGRIVQDFLGRFDAGRGLMSSNVYFVSDDIVKTKNSIYELEGELVCVDVPFVLMPLVERGICPRRAAELWREYVRECAKSEEADHG